MNKKKITLLFTALGLLLSMQLFSLPLSSLSPDQTIWFTQPAKSWAEQALHIGNGYMGASFYGDVNTERFDIAEKTFWTGGPHAVPDFNYGVVKGGKDKIALIREKIAGERFAEADSLCRLYMVGDYSNYGYFSMVGNLLMTFDIDTKSVKDYVRGLDLSSSRGFVEYTSDEVKYTREYLCSYPDKLMALHLTADKKKSIGFTLSHELIYKPETVKGDKDELIFSGVISGNGLRYCVRIKVLRKGGTVRTDNRTLIVEGADEATVLYAVDTEYKPVYPSYKGENPEENTKKTIREAVRKGYVGIWNAHVADYKDLYDRVKLTLVGDKDLERLPTDERVRQLQKGCVDDASLKTLWFNLSRYLVISASRPGTLPSTLQGVWNTFEKAPWNGNFQSNINLQEMYWGCGPTNLPECEEAYLEWIEGLVESGRVTAREYYGTEGWVSHSTGNIWGHTVPGDDILWGLYPSGAAWHCRHLWEHYAFSEDEAYLKVRAYPVMKEAAEFYLANLVDYRGYYVVSPSVSAEHGIEMRDGKPVAYSTSNGEQTAGRLFTVPAYQDIEMVYDLFTNVIKASECLNIDTSFRDKLIAAKEKMLPLKVGRYGQLQEWTDDVDNPRDHHRHVAHLYALYPGNMISVAETPDLASAVKRALELRGDGKFGDRWPHTGGNWSAAWRMALWTRLMNGDKAIHVLNQMIKDSGYENMMSTQSGNMQVDATMATSGVFAEMLLQSQDGFLNLLPCLPTEWPEGKVDGLMARGGYRVSVEWECGKLIKAEINLPKGGKRPLVKVQSVSIQSDDKRIVFNE